MKDDVCPLCDSNLELKVKETINGDKYFVACSGYPNICSGYIHRQMCPECGCHMVIRKAITGEEAGKLFWGCSNYPKCKRIVPILNQEIKKKTWVWMSKTAYYYHMKELRESRKRSYDDDYYGYELIMSHDSDSEDKDWMDDL